MINEIVIVDYMNWGKCYVITASINYQSRNRLSSIHLHYQLMVLLDYIYLRIDGQVMAGTHESKLPNRFIAYYGLLMKYC